MTIGETMSDNSIKLGFELEDKGESVSKNIKNVEALNKKVNELGNTAASTGKKMAASYQAPSKTLAGISGASMSTSERLEYDQARASVGTGAAGRDFAKQAQGLGGLVHVYATFAANLFAVSAAFTALKNAADTTSMVKGLDQLGASSGRNLGTLAQRISELSDGAINLREAMTATAQATAAGMSSKNLERLTLVAKTASQALGIDMGDALSRLSRGVTKIEPELLDELGIFVKIDEATSSYARQIGKTATSLTDFERRQAFANAVLDEGERKFASIKLDANPYNKILASMQNLAQTGLELVNKVFTPILSVLSESPTALGAAMASIGAILLKQAIPAIGMFRENARQMAAETHERLKAQLKEQQAYAIRSDAIIEANAEKEYLTSKMTSKKLEEIQESRFNKQVLGSRVRGLLTKSPFDLTEQESAEITKKHEDLAAKINAGSATADEKLQHDKLSKRELRISAIRAEAKEAGAAAQEIHEASDEKWYAHQTLMRKKQQAMERAESKAHVLSMAADNAAIYGPKIAFGQLGTDVSKMNVGPLAKTLTYVQGAASIATTYLSNLLNVYGMYVAIATAAFAILDSLLSNNAKQVEKYNKNIDTLSASFDNVSRTMDVIASKSPFDVLSIDSIQARANAFNELTTAATSTVTSFVELTKATSGWDKLKDVFFDVFGKGTADVLSTNLAKAVTSSINLMQEGPAKKAAQKKLENIIGDSVDIENFKSIEKSLRNLTDAEIAEKGKLIASALSDISREANNTASVLTGLKTSFAETSKTVQTAIAELSPKDVFGKTGASLVSNSVAISDALKAGPIEALNTLNEIIKNNEVLSLLPKDTVVQLQAAKKELQSINEQLGGTEKARLEAEKSIEALKAKGTYKTKVAGSALEGYRNLAEEVLTEEAALVEGTLVALEATRKNLTESAEKATANFAELDKVVFKAGIDKLTVSLKGAFEEGGIAAAKGYLSVLKGIGGETAAEEGKLRAREISIQMENVKATYSHITAIQENTRALAEKTAKDDLRDAAESLKTATGPVVIDKYLTQAADAQRRLDVINEERRLTGAGTKGIKGAMSEEASKSGSMSEITREALKNLGPVIAQMFTMEGQLAKLVGAQTANSLQTMAATINESAQTTKRSLDQATARNNIELDSINSTITLSSMYDEMLYKRKNELEIANQLNTYLAEYAAINSKVLIANELITASQKNNSEAQLSSNQQYLAAVEAKKKAETDLDTLKTSNVLKLGRLQAKQDLDAFTAKSTTEKRLLDTYLTLGGISEREYNNSLLKTENTKEELRTAQAIAEVRSLATTKAAEYAAKGDTSGAEKIKADSESAVAGLEAQKTKQQELNAAINEQKNALAGVKTMTESLTAVFGTLGTSIGNAVGSITEYAISSKAMTSAHKDNMKGLEIGSEKYTEQADKNARERTNFELQSTAKIAGSTKKLFNEKTLAYKTLDKVEKAAHIYRLAMDAKELAFKIGNAIMGVTVKAGAEASSTGITFAGVAARMPAYIAEIYASWGAMGPWMAAAAGAYIATNLTGFGKGGGATVPSALSEGKGTILGDPNAKSESIAKSISALKDVDVITMQHSGNMVKYLRSIDSNIGALGTSLFRVVGVADNIAESKLGATNQNWINYTGISSLDKVITSFVGSIPLVGNLVNKVGKVFGFGSSSSVTGQGILINPQSLKAITEGGISAGYYADVSSKSSALGITYSSSSSTKVTPLEKEAALQLTRVFEGISGAVKSATTALGADSVAVASAIEKYVVNIGKINLSGLSQTEVLERLNNVFSAVTDKVAESVIPGLDAFVKVGSGYSEALFRVAAGVEEANAVLVTINKTAIKYTDILNKQGDVAAEIVRQTISASETQSLIKQVIDNFDGSARDILDAYTALDTVRDTLVAMGISADFLSAATVTAAGGLDRFTNSIASFLENFGTQAAKSAISADKVRETFSTLGIQIPKTRDAVYTLVTALTTTAPKSAAAIISIVDSLDAFYTGLEDFASNRDALVNKTLELTGQTGTLKTIQRGATLAETDPRLVALQKYVFALEDVKDAESVLLKLRQTEKNTLESSITAMKGYLTSITKFKDSLLVGQLSPLTAAEKYAESKKQFDAIFATATGVAATPEEQKAKETALSQLESSSTAFLDASKVYNASSAQYTSDFNYIQSALTSTASTLSSQISTAELTLVAANTQIDLLSGINTGITSVADAITALATATATANAAKIPATNSLNTSPLDDLTQSGGFKRYAAAGKTPAQFYADIKTYSKGVTDQPDVSVDDKMKTIAAAAISSQVSQTDIATALQIPIETVTEFLARSGLTVPMYAKGGYASGMSLVGEKGPELIDFSNPGRVYTAEQTNGMFNGTNQMGAMVSELRQLRQEVQELRKQQSNETGQLVMATYDSSNQAATEMANTVAEFVTKQNWSNTVRQNVKLN